MSDSDFINPSIHRGEQAKPSPSSPNRLNGFHVNWRWPDLAALILPVLFSLALLSAQMILPHDRVFLGFTQVDQVVYYASARETFENGNGLFYASPYSNLPDSPRLYSHLVFLFFGYLWKIFGLSFAAIDYGVRVVFGAVMLGLAVRIFRAALPEKRFSGYGGLVLISCSGLAWWVGFFRLLTGYLMNVSSSEFHHSLREWLGLYSDLVAEAEGGYGDWHLSLLRNLTFAPEVMYHVLFFASALCLLHEKFAWGVFFQFLAWWAHPFTGLELGMIASGFLAIEFFFFHHKLLRPIIASLAINALFLGYYALFLPRFPEHASVDEQNHHFGNPMLFSMVFPAYGLFSVMTAFFFLSRRCRSLIRGNAAARFFLIWLIGATFLVFHDRILFFVRPWQPMHFNRGYVFIPLVFFSMCWIQLVLAPRMENRRRILKVLLVLLFAAHLPDDPFKLWRLRGELARKEIVYSTPRKNYELLRKLDAIPETLTLHAFNLPPDYESLEYLIPVLTHHRALTAHYLNTPYYQEKKRQAADLFNGFSKEKLKLLNITALVVNEAAYETIVRALAPGEYHVALSFVNLKVVQFRF